MKYSLTTMAILLTCFATGCTAAHGDNTLREATASQTTASGASTCVMAGHVYSQLRAGQTPAITEALHLRRHDCYAGSTLEDLDIDMGAAFFAQPRLAHKLFVENHVTTDEARTFFLATPWSYVDRFCAQKRLFQQRIATLNALPSTSFNKDKVVASLQDTLQTMTQACRMHPENTASASSS